MKNKILLTISLLTAVLVMNSCLKDDVGEDWTDSLKGKMYAEIPRYGAQVFVIQPVATDQIFKFLVNIATDTPPSSAVTVSTEIDPSVIQGFNDDMHAADTSIHWSYELYPGASIIDPTVTIEAGTRNAYVHIKLPGADKLNLTKKYILPISLTNVTGGPVIAENKKTVLFKLPIANKWEGTYKYKGYILRAGDDLLTGYYKNRTMKMSTAGPNSVIMESGLSWAGNNGGVGGIGKWEITISEGTVPNTIAIKDPTNAAVKLLTTYPNRYDPATRTFYMSVYWGNGPTHRATTDTLVYSGPY